MQTYQIIIIGGGAAGIFAALAAKTQRPTARVIVLEKTNVLLSKVKVSGGGRCNVTHSCFDPKELVQNYPRGSRELLGPFHHFQPADTIDWFEKRGVELKTEADGRMFPITDSSLTIIDCLLSEAENLGVEILTRQKIENIDKTPNGYEVQFADKPPIQADKLLLATGSTSQGHAWAAQFGHTIIEPLPSLFTFNIPNSRLRHLSGISQNPVEIKLTNTNLSQKGPLLITHFGLSGPAVLKLSGFGARELHACHYSTKIALNWLPDQSEQNTYQTLLQIKKEHSLKMLCNLNPFNFAKNLWKTFTHALSSQKLHHVSNKDLQNLSHTLHHDLYYIEGKTTHKEEFVTCGGVDLKEVNFKTLESRVSPGLFFAGEILDIDGITGGFNFQNAWTTGYIAGKALGV
ncbi:MAG: hypothetical protein S4CHLAM123_03190 [Chlamydiales bacterium]|nr:hypothetical protein [Chlamydiales bacterium]